MKVWIEKTIVKGRKDRLEGDLKLGKALWSPTKDKRGADIYNSMRDVSEGDIVLHLTDNKGISAISKVSKPYYEGNGAIGSDWEGSAYIIELNSFTELTPPLNRTDLLNESNRTVLDNIRSSNKVFYNSGLTLNQGAYLTEAPFELVDLINTCYRDITESPIPFIKELIEQKPKKQYWLYAPGENARNWHEFYENGIMALGWDKIGDLQQYKSRTEIKKALVQEYGGDGSKKNDVTANDDFQNKINVGDIVIAKKGRGELLGYGVVTSDYKYDNSRTEYHKLRKVDWKLKGNWKVDFSLVLKTLTDITKYTSDHPGYDTYYERLLGIMGMNNKTEKEEKMDFPLNTILYGPPGTGKTYNTILRAAQIIENRAIDSYSEALNIFKANLHDQIEFITFHQNYSYEDFIQGLRPETDNKSSLVFDKKDGVFKKIADKAFENLKLIQKAPEELTSEAKFDKALELFSDKVLESEDNFKINDTAYIFEVEDDAFRYTGEKWTNHANGLRMKFSDLREFYRNKVDSRKDVKKMTSISGLANQHATYYFLVYSEILKLLPKKTEEPQRVARKNYVIIIDEINRANISRVFGELITLIEPDKRSHGAIPLEARLPSGDPFIVPSNLFIIGTMNTADKSIALLDIALRRRFEFESMYPKYEITGQEIYDVEILKKINELVIKSKGHDFQIGHAYFMGKNKDLVQRMNKKVIPLLLEYYMNDEKEVKRILNSAGLIIEENSWPLKISGKND